MTVLLVCVPTCMASCLSATTRWQNEDDVTCVVEVAFTFDL